MSARTAIPNKVKELVIAKIEAHMPSHLSLSIGSSGSLTKDDLIQHVKKGDEIGRQVVHAHLSFLKAVASGALVKEMISVDHE